MKKKILEVSAGPDSNSKYGLEVNYHNDGDHTVVIERDFSSKTITMSFDDAKRLAEIILELTATPVPSEIYYSVANDNFYDRDFKGMGLTFYNQWWPRRKDFPPMRTV